MTQSDLTAAAARFAGRPPAEIMAWAAERFPGRVVFATGFGAEGCVLIDMVARHSLAIDLVTLDTGLLFDETYALWRRLERRYGIVIQAKRPEQTVYEQGQAHGERLWERDPDRCCALRKVEPLEALLAGREAWITAIRRDQTKSRAFARSVEPDPLHGLVKINPLLSWSAADVAAYVKTHDVPVNPLHERGYPSIGCHPCTSPVAAGEDPRSGRWRGREKKECGLHARPVPSLSVEAPRT
ncbi:MAG TPA: phosphoadenylyl-sulfate reductase [Vicinamibacteria bacterium]